MKFIRHLRFEDLPTPQFTGEEHKDEPLVREFNEVFDQLAAALGQLYLVDDEGGIGIKGAPIVMSRHVDICRSHTIVVSQQAWHPDVVRILHEQLQLLSPDWMFAIDASEFPPGQAHIVVEANGTIHAWSDFPARSTLSAFGFPKFSGPVQIVRFCITSLIDGWRRSRRVRKFLADPSRDRPPAPMDD